MDGESLRAVGFQYDGVTLSRFNRHTKSVLRHLLVTPKNLVSCKTQIPRKRFAILKTYPKKNLYVYQTKVRLPKIVPSHFITQHLARQKSTHIMAETPTVPSNLRRKPTVAAQAAHGAADMTRRMICGGLAGMIAKVSCRR